MKETFKGKKLLTIFVPGSNSMKLGIHDDEISSSLKKSDKTIVLTQLKPLKRRLKNNIKINVIETEAQIGDYLHNENNFDIILILSNRNTENILRYIRNG